MNYSNFPFKNLTYKQIIDLMLESIRLKDYNFIIACREHLIHRKPENVKN